MKDYQKYQVSDFLLDDSFVSWAQNQNKSQHELWSAFLDFYPEKEEEFYQAKRLVATIRIRPSRELSETEISDLVKNVASVTYLQEQTGNEKLDIRPMFRISILKIAAAILLVSAASFLIYNTYSPKEQTVVAERFIETTNNQPEPMLIKLSDNSSVILKPKSSIRYQAAFSKTKREVYLDGEAFFEVSKDKTRPFLVYSNELVTKVLGTSFLVKAFKGNQEFKVVVNTGKVSVFPRKVLEKPQAQSASLDNMGGEGLLLTPNEELTFDRKATKLVKKELEHPAVLSEIVTKNTLNFVDTPFSEVINTLGTAYDIKINYDKQKMGKCPLTASLANQPLSEKLRLICKAVEADYEIDEGVVIIKGKGCESL